MADELNGGGQNPAGNESAGAGGGTTGAGADSGAKPGEKGGAAAGVGGATDKVFSFKEDRSDWLPRHRLSEVSGRATKAEERAKTLEGELERERSRVRVALGVDKADPKAQETAELRAAIQSLVPELKALEGITVDQLRQVLQEAEAARETSQATWARHAQGMLSELETEAGRILGTDKLSDRQRGRLQQAYREEAAAALQARPVDERTGRKVDTTGNDFLTRHERGDKTLVKEFAKAFLDDWFEPARRSVTAATTRRQFRPVPQGAGSRQQLATGQEKVNLNNDTDFKKALLAARGAGQE